MRKTAIAAISLLVAGSAFAGGLFDDDCKHTSPRNLNASAAGVTKVVIRGESGFLHVEGRQGATAVTTTGTACTSDDDFLGRITLTQRRDGSTLYIDANIPSKTVYFGFFQARLDFSVTLPAGLPVTIDDDSGTLKVSNTGALTIDDDSGSIEVRNIRGNVDIDDDSGEITVDGITGNVKISDDSGSIDVKNVNGSVEIEDDSGSITVTRIEGSLRVRDDDSGSIDVADIRGDFSVDRKGSGGIDYARVSGKVNIPERHRR